MSLSFAGKRQLSQDLRTKDKPNYACKNRRRNKEFLDYMKFDPDIFTDHYQSGYNTKVNYHCPWSEDTHGLFKFLKNVAEVNLLADDRVEILDLDTLLLHCVTVTDSYATVVE